MSRSCFAYTIPIDIASTFFFFITLTTSPVPQSSINHFIIDAIKTIDIFVFWVLNPALLFHWHFVSSSSMMWWTALSFFNTSTELCRGKMTWALRSEKESEPPDHKTTRRSLCSARVTLIRSDKVPAFCLRFRPRALLTTLHGLVNKRMV